MSTWEMVYSIIAGSPTYWLGNIVQPHMLFSRLLWSRHKKGFHLGETVLALGSWSRWSKVRKGGKYNRRDKGLYIIAYNDALPFEGNSVEISKGYFIIGFAQWTEEVTLQLTGITQCGARELFLCKSRVMYGVMTGRQWLKRSPTSILPPSLGSSWR